MREPHQVSDGTVVVGGGLAGAAAALRLAQSGRAPLLLERETAPHDKICGEFLSVEAQRHLRALGIDLARFGAPAIRRVRLVDGARVVTTRLPFTALGLTRRALDAALLDGARAAGVRVEQAAARTIGGGTVTTDTGELRPAATLLATGKHDLRGAARDATGTIADLIGFKMYFRLSAPAHAALDDHIEVHLTGGGYAGLQLVEGGRANLCLLTRRAAWDAAGAAWEPFLQSLLAANPVLRARLAGAEPLLPRPLTIARVPYGYVSAADDGVYRLGDQAAVIPSFCGDGMAIALHSARLAADAVLAGAGPQVYAARVRRDVGRGVRWATALQRAHERGAGRGVLMTATRVVPPLLGMAAWATRVPAGALRRAGV